MYIDIKLVFSIVKVKQFIVKDFVCLCLHVVYKFTCAGCNASYIGKTPCHICTHVCEHLVLDNASHVYKHLESSKACRDSRSTECFTVLDSANSSLKIKKKEALHIKWHKHTLIQQLQHVGLSHSV